MIVDGRKNPELPEGWWNWNGIVRPVRWCRRGPRTSRTWARSRSVRCRGARPRLPRGAAPRRAARAAGPARDRAVARREAALAERSRDHRTASGSRASARSERRLRLSMRVPAPELWSPDAPQLYSAEIILRERGRVVQRERRRIGLRSVRGEAGAPVAEQPPDPAARGVDPRGHAGLRRRPHRARTWTASWRTSKDLGANITRAHYLLNERLLARLDRAGILVWNQAPIWQRDHRRAAALAAEGARARAAHRAPHRHGRAQPSVRAHPLGGQRADLHARTTSRARSASCSRPRPRRATSTPRCRSRSTSRAARASPSSSPTTRST